MCVGIPMQVVRGDDTRALCRGRDGSETWIDLLLTGAQPPGTWLLTFLGAAREVLDPERAAQIGAAVDALGDLLSGRSTDIDAAFADLIERGPQLPDFLRKDTTP
ncbi:HypC/HybG/HupF family hydrogenase formation chaperone [Thauera sp. CAU 1555]|uniref:HypC/HybG/HupF family hydrogenase formation chaperone n=1 Tax=Thauera sedimentorum TaxID=2767595 RepID=A0ABR9BAQ9_9RHOO|nr:HypC/HybG/HupF family hydrogenase formation chaperone [Thauera sedimentorum]MBC9072514.1 HypC/HybG/HupF family hydrogenase formation chaperone [Thauera sedimentorum]MBD8503433.1 HypC/HybG/HupF family hydrogenase formation chaperone [Thauera sedimentorum]